MSLTFYRPSRDLWDLIDFPERLFGQRFGMGLDDEDFYPSSLLSIYGRPSDVPRRQYSNVARSGTSEVVNAADKFQVRLDVGQFKPEEINVKMVDNNSITIEGKHEEKQDDHGYISRQFVRRYVLPKGVEADKVTSSLSSEGVLTITAPKKAIEAPKPTEKVIPVSIAAPMETEDNQTAKKK